MGKENMTLAADAPQSQVDQLLAHRGQLAQRLRPDDSLFARLGGRATLARVIDGLYDRIEADKELRPLFRPSLFEERVKQKAFFEEWTGGEPGYSHHHAYNSLRQRHSHKPITRRAAGLWLGHMREALRDAVSNDKLVDEFLETLKPLARGLVNEDTGVHSCGDKTKRQARLAAARGQVDILRQLVDDAPELLLDPFAAAEIVAEAVERGHREAVALLLDRGADVNVPGRHRARYVLPTPLCVARLKKQDDLAAALVEWGAIYDIFTAAYLGDLKGIADLLDRTPELVNAHDPACGVLSVTPLLHAVAGGHLEAVAALFDRGAELGMISSEVARTAVDLGDVRMVKLLLDKGADVTRLGPGRWVMNDELAGLALEHGADVNYPAGRWAWISCSGNNNQQDDPEYVRALLDCGADVSVWIPLQRPAQALHVAARAGHVEILKVLLANGADVHAANGDGETPLHYALKAAKRADLVATLGVLLRAGAEAADRLGKTPLASADRLRRHDADRVREVLRH